VPAILQKRSNAVCVQEKAHGYEVFLVNPKGKFILAFEDTEAMAWKVANRIYGNLE